jgi:hypothetical protein
LALIELDLTGRPDPALASPPPARRYRIPGLLLAAVLAVALGGSAPGVPTLWREVGTVPVGGTDTPFVLAGSAIYGIASAGHERIVTAWEIGGSAPRKLWTAASAGRVADPDDVGFSRVDAVQAGDVVLLSDGPATSVLDARTGRLRWALPVPVTPLPGGRVGVVQRQEFRAGTVYDQDSGEPGQLYFSSTGEPHTEPPLRTEVRGVDLDTGATLWSTSPPGAVNVLTPSGGSPAVLILSSDRLERRDGDTGAVQRQLALPEIDGNRPVGGNLVGGKLIVVYGSTDNREVGYAPETLDRLWDRLVPEVLLDPPSCADLLCDGGRAALDILDPATGRAQWRAPGDVDLSRWGGYVVEYDSRSGLVRRLVDPATGGTRVDLTAWRSEAVASANQPLVAGSDSLRGGDPLVLRRYQGGGATVFGVVIARRDAVQPLGVISGTVSDCTADHRYVVCRGTGGLRIWAYRS